MKVNAHKVKLYRQSIHNLTKVRRIKIVGRQTDSAAPGSDTILITKYKILTILHLKCENRILHIKISLLAVENSLLAQNNNFSKGVKILINTYANNSRKIFRPCNKGISL